MKDYKLDLEIEFAIHLADLHIYNEDGGIISRQDEYEQVFKNLIIDIKNNKKIKKNNTIIYIAGDIFDAARREKGRTTSTAVTLFKNLISKLSKLGVVVIIPGNHDNNITYKSKEDHTITDTLTGVLEGINGMDSNICYLKDTGIYKIGNCIFYHTSVFDIDSRSGSDKYKERLSFLPNKLTKYDKCIHICALHCGIETQQLSNGYILKDCAFRLDDLKHYDFTMLGDNHKHQYLDLDKTIAYPGSLIQQNHGESIHNHGYILWNLKEKTNDYHEIPNDYGFITININQDTNIDTIDFPKNSRIKLIYNIKQDNIELIKDSIKLKTNVVNWKEKKQIIQNSSEQTIDNNLNDIDIFTSYLKTKYPENSKQYTFIYNKIFNLLKTRKLGNGNTSWIFNKLIVENFQIYKGTHTLLDLENHPKNTIISILGENTHGKSTILRALSYVIWGKDILNLEEYINNQSKTSKCILEFMYCNQKYKITRELNIKKEIAKETLKFEQFIDNIWINKTGSQKNHTKNELITVFGERDDAKSTWLCCQNSSVSFLNDTHNINIFSKLIGIDLFKNEYDLQQSNAKKIAIELKVKKNAMDSININFSDDLEQQINTLEFKQTTLTENNLIIEKIIEQERTKEKFGTHQDYNKWKQTLKNKTTQLEDLNFNLLDTTHIDILQTDINRYYTEKDILLSKKTPIPIDINIDTLSNKIYQSNTKIHQLIDYKINLESKLKLMEHINNDHYENTISEISLLEAKIKTLQTNKNDIVNMETEKKTIEMENNNININELEDSNYLLEKQIEDTNTTILKNEGFLNGFNMDTFNQDKIKLTSISTKLENLQKSKINKLATIKTLTDSLINIEYDELTIDNHISKFNSMQKLLLVEENNINNLDDIINRNTNDLSKHKRLEFDDNCICCTSNKQHFKIDIFQYNIIENNTKKTLLNTNISKLKNDIDNLRWIEQCKLSFIKNNEIQLQINSENKELEHIDAQLQNVQELFCNINSKLDSYKLKENTKIENDKLIIHIQHYYTTLKKTKSIISTYQSNIDKLDTIISHIKSIYVPDTELTTNQNRLEQLRHKQYIFNERIKIQTNLDETVTNIKTTNMEIDTYNKNIDIIKSNICIENDIKTIEQLILTNKLDLERMLDVQTIQNEIININTKITDYKHYNPKLIEQHDIERKDNYKQIIHLAGHISTIKKDLDTYNYNKQQYDTLKLEFNTIDMRFNLLTNYINILEEYPQNLMDDYLAIFESKVNDFISFSGFNYTTKFQRPFIKKEHKNNKHKFIITHQKNNKYFSTLSGAEQFTFNLATITSLGCISNTTKSPILAIDEGFSCLDSNHLNEIESVLEYIKTQVHYIINISHIESIHKYANTKIKINNGNII